jgi:CRP-like cAMP-binding protein
MTQLQLSSLTKGHHRLLVVLPASPWHALRHLRLCAGWQDAFSRIKLIAPAEVYTLAGATALPDTCEVLLLSNDERLLFSGGIFVDANGGALARALYKRSSGLITVSNGNRGEIRLAGIARGDMLQQMGLLLGLPTIQPLPAINLPAPPNVISAAGKPVVIMDCARSMRLTARFLARSITRYFNLPMLWTSPALGTVQLPQFNQDALTALATARSALITITTSYQTAAFLHEAGAAVLLVSARRAPGHIPTMKPHDTFELKRHLHAVLNNTRGV